MKASTTINLGHGSGGLLSRKLLDDIIFDTFHNPYLQKKHDGSVVRMEGPMAVSTDTFVISPIFFKGGNIGELAVNGTVNDVAMCGGIPKYLSLGFVIEEGLSIQDFKTIVQSIKVTADKAGVEIITGDTKVVEKGKGDKIFINTTGFGHLHPSANIDMLRVEAGDLLVVNGPIAQHGMAIMSEREGLSFESEITSDTRHLNRTVEKLLDAFGSKIHLFRDATRGGLASVLSEIAVDTNLGVQLLESEIPVDIQVAAACEMLGLDPLYVANEGVFVSVIHPEIKEDFLQLLTEVDGPSGIRCIGTITADHPQKVILNTSLGARRVVTPLIGEQLPRIC